MHIYVLWPATAVAGSRRQNIDFLNAAYARDGFASAHIHFISSCYMQLLLHRRLELFLYFCNYSFRWGGRGSLCENCYCSLFTYTKFVHSIIIAWDTSISIHTIAFTMFTDDQWHTCSWRTPTRKKSARYIKTRMLTILGYQHTWSPFVWLCCLPR